MNLTIFHQNVDRIQNKIEILNHTLLQLNPDLVVITEHGNSPEQILNTKLINFSLVAAYCREDRMKGGVAIYKNNSLKNETSNLELEHLSIPLVCEVAAMRITLSNSKVLLIVGIYRPPSGSLAHTRQALEILAEILDLLPTNNNSHVLLIGDININDLESKTERSMLNELLASFSMVRIQLPPIRITPTSATSIDAVCTDLNLDQVTVRVVPTGISDHTGQLCSLQLPISLKKPTIVSRRITNLTNLTQLKNRFALESWDHVLGCSDTNDAYNNFIATVTLILDLTCPPRKSRSGRNKRREIFCSEEVRELKRRFLEANNQYLLSGGHGDKIRANTLKKSYDLKLKELRRTFNSNHISTSDNKSKAIWDVINCERNPNKVPQTEVKSLSVDEVNITDPNEIASCFNQFFVDIAEKTLQSSAVASGHSPPTPTVEEVYNGLVKLNEFTATKEAELIRTIDSIKQKPSAGLDEISSRMVKFCREELLVPLVHICNLSFQQGRFPSKLKVAKVFPLHKRGKQEDMGNYRPISLVPTF
ncbi:uncharacterized protein LOC124369570 [Homalodisca vitripennis]|uniref:uncharacterized protein LOC124369570 n=1 Tax=Homalodisca vitripennis TaxID=197043 RepID=UPI001EEBE58E|nr:uncharacterized protein LOC124369570 [Homalodisca vitripennis]